MTQSYSLHNIVALKKPHPCGTNSWEILFIGAEIKLKCTGCNRIVMIDRQSFDKSLRKIISAAAQQNTNNKEDIHK